MSFFGKPIQGITYTGGGYDDNTGYIGEGTPTPITINGTIQPTTGKDLDAIPENRRSSASYKIYSFDELHIADTDEEQSDELTIRGKQFEVIAKLPWQNDLINHFKYIVSKKEGV